MRRDDAARVLGIDREQDGDRSRRGDDHVVTADTRSLARHEDPRNVRRISRVTAAAQPPTGSPLAKTIEFERGVVREVRDVVRTPRK